MPTTVPTLTSDSSPIAAETKLNEGASLAWGARRKRKPSEASNRSASACGRTLQAGSAAILLSSALEPCPRPPPPWQRKSASSWAAMVDDGVGRQAPRESTSRKSCSSYGKHRFQNKTCHREKSTSHMFKVVARTHPAPQASSLQIWTATVAAIYFTHATVPFRNFQRRRRGAHQRPDSKLSLDRCERDAELFAFAALPSKLPRTSREAWAPRRLALGLAYLYVKLVIQSRRAVNM